MAATKPLKIGLIIGTTRVHRIGPEVATFILDTLNRTSPTLQSPQKTTIDRIDLKDHNLPFFDEPIIPKEIHSLSGYHNDHTRLWSQRISSCDAFIFLSAQRNWSIPPELKNAIDYLYHEWTGKPAAIFTYGGHGGTQCAEHLRAVLGAMGVRVLERGVCMAFEGSEFRGNALAGRVVGLDAAREGGFWAGYRGEFVRVFEELVERAGAVRRERENGAVF
ncbi:hypothetical protein M409DRAFT_36659 [Zasmidium cellare ATCC 36951]|uniref:NADPH-dependent FMN reductase-like domain-containing protein n=1 Tax=Zasmidium cellare ATCC 36951 TaxID=1080233 RepID=A0A6A6CJS1_ZASCE|nr:uncharacterized protein M409DRAFT_36659 [Zasmidium cellare ATCC 36951]KAF2166863.1 hypothetical protein M409DRAFT_36659 [Zasmidium cellare ATCC 36951]